jgi:hypothetical protein
MTKAAKNLFRGFDEKAGPGAPLAVAPPPQTATAKDKAERQKSRQGKKVVTYYLEPEPFTQLKILSAKDGLTVQELMIEALNLLFEQRQLSRIAR